MSGDVSLSAVAQHAVDESVIDWSSATVIDGHPNFYQRCAQEAWPIRSQDSLMNRDSGPCTRCTTLRSAIRIPLND